MSKQVEDIDSIITFLFLKKLMTPITKTSAYDMGIVDSLGRKVKEPDTDAEKASFTLLDKAIFKIKRLLGSKLTQLHAFLYLQTLNSSTFYSKLVAKGSVESKAEIKRIRKDLERVAESYNCGVNDLLQILISEDIVKNQGMI